MKQPCAVNLHNLVTVETTSLGRRLAQLGDAKMSQVCGAIAFSLGCEG
jgi:mRNA-degrading endonuclease toxin of MazEF toxin-antitoxin module